MVTSESVVFTICSFNYLAQAITLGDSLKKSNPDIIFRIYLVDKLNGREFILESIPYKVIEIEDVPVTDFEGMCIRYNITELNTSVKPFIIDHIFKTETTVNKVLYFDPDIMVFGRLDELYQNLDRNTVILTPHLLTPSDDHPYGLAEKNFLVAGTFNLGFIAISRQRNTFEFLDWWKKKLIHQGYGNNAMHLFYDQKWLNLAIVFFQNIYIEMSPGYNMASWNLHEREITGRMDEGFVVNGKYELVFYHFSGVSEKSYDVSTHSNYTIEERPDLKEILHAYRASLVENGSDSYKTMKCYYTKFYIGIVNYYPKYHVITLYRRARVNLGKFRRIVLGYLEVNI